MKVQEGHIPAYLVEAVGPPPVVAWCTVCERRTIRPKQAMMDRHGSVITDGCGDCVPSPLMPPPGIPPNSAPLQLPPLNTPALNAPWPTPTRQAQAQAEGGADDLGPIFIATSHGVIQGWPKDDDDEEVVFIAR